MHKVISTDDGEYCYRCGTEWVDGAEELAVYPCVTGGAPAHVWVPGPGYAECGLCGTTHGPRDRPGELVTHCGRGE